MNTRQSNRKPAAPARPRWASVLSAKVHGGRRKRKGKRKRTRKKPRKNARIFNISFWIAIGILTVLFVWSICMRPHDGSGETGAAVPAGHYLYAVDLSHHNHGKIVWDSLRVMTDAGQRTVKSVRKAENIVPVSYVILKASEGEGMKDNKFSKNWNDADEAGIRRGAYHFYRSSKDPLKQAQNYMHATGRLKESDLPPILDIETTHRGCSKKMLNENVLKWLKIIEAHYGRTPIVYTSESFARDILDRSITEHYPLWIAHYGVQKPDKDGWDIWQFTDRAVVYGIEGRVDLNVLSLEFGNRQMGR